MESDPQSDPLPPPTISRKTMTRGAFAAVIVSAFAAILIVVLPEQVKPVMKYIVNFFEWSHLNKINPARAIIPVSFFIFLVFAINIAYIHFYIADLKWEFARVIFRSQRHLYHIQKHIIDDKEESDRSKEFNMNQIIKDNKILEDMLLYDGCPDGVMVC